MTMTNPFQSPRQTDVDERSQSWPNLGSACLAGIKFAFRWVSIVIAPLLVIIFVVCIGAFAYRAIVQDIWPDFNSPQLYYSIGALLLSLLAAYVVACFWVCLAAALIYGAKHLANCRGDDRVLE
ncbi:MAG: hypothetical protein AAGA30_16005 [Planctomycetota bacterium]